MTVHPSLEGRDLLADDRYPGYRAALEAERDRWEASMTKIPRADLNPQAHHAHMTRCAGAISALDFALGKPEQMKDSTPESTPTPSPSP